MKKRWLYTTVMVGLLTMAVTGGVAAAHFGGGGGGGDVRARAAEILGVDQTALEDALGQAHEEAMTEQLQARLDQFVANDVITQERADEYTAWNEARPDGLAPGRGFGPGGERLQSRLEQAVANGTITQEQADEFSDWMEARPDDLGLGRGFDKHGRGHGMGHGRHHRGPGQQAPVDPAAAPTSFDDVV